jgi:hypothetical protein
MFSDPVRLHGATLLGLSMVVSSMSGADTNAPPAAVSAPLTPEQMFEGGAKTYNNWIDLDVGGFIVGGNQSQFQQGVQSEAGPFGGISDFHYQRELDKRTTLSADGRALFNENDYKLNLAVTREKLGYFRFSYQEFRTWYNGDGGFFPPSGAWYPWSGNALGLDRGALVFEGGLRMEKVPEITFRYTHDFRDGEKSSTIWGYTHPAGGTVTRGLSPSVYDIDEHSDAFELDVAHHLKATDLGVGVRYESGSLNNALKITQFPGETIQQRVTDRQGTTYDMFNVHAFTETWFKKSLMFSSGFSYADLDNDFSGSRIYGADFDASYVPNAQSGFGYYGLQGESRLHEYVLNLNLMANPFKYWSIVPSLRARKQDLNGSFTANETLADNAATPISGNNDRTDLEMRERLDVTWTGLTNWVFNARGEWTQGQGDLTENGGLGPVNGIGVPPIQRQTDDNRFFQKYSLDARWYPVRRITVNVGGYYKLNDYDYDSSRDSTPNNSANRYPAYLVTQQLQTYDANAGLTLRPRQNVTLVSRYEYQSSVTHTAPDPVSGLGNVESSEMVSQIFAQNVSWAPWSRLNLQAGLNYVVSKTQSPVSDYTQAILNAQNNYWIVDFSAGVVLDDKTDLNLNFFYYRANDYTDNSSEGVPYGAGATQYGITAALVKRLTSNLRLNLKYGFSHYLDEPSGGHLDYQAHLISSSLQYRF